MRASSQASRSESTAVGTSDVFTVHTAVRRLPLVKITYVEANGQAHTVDAKVGETVMESAVKNSVPGIAADCGGACACATCRVYVNETWRSKTGAAEEMELSMLEFVAVSQPNCRLSCQIKVTEELDGLVVHMPPNQHEGMS